MSLTIHAERPPLLEISHNVIRVGGTRVPLERVLRAFLNGCTAEQIAQDFEVLKLQDVYAVISYYLQNRSEVDSWLAEIECETSQIRAETEKQYDPAGIRERLLRRSKK
ncbi:MAG: DUF433 domain-containing protein [Schlesneria sp.]